MSVKLTEGSLDKIAKGEKVFGPVLQVLDLRAVQQPQPSGQAREKYRMTLNDGVYTYLAYVATQSTKPFMDHTIQEFSIIRLQEYCLSAFSNTNFIIIAKVELIQPFNAKIGNPVPVGSDPQPKTENAPAAAAEMPPSPMKSTNRVISSPTRQGQKVFTDASSSAAAGDAIFPVKSLHPYQNVWSIRVRVTSKSALKDFARKTGTGTGKVFSVDLIDQAGDEIRATAFNDVAEKLFNILEVGRVFVISKGDIKVANKKFTTIPNQYEIMFNSTTVVSPVSDDSTTGLIPTMHFSFVPIEKVAAMEKDELVDVIGVITQASDVQMFTQKSTGRELTKKTLTIVDNTAYSIEVTLWGELANTDGVEVGKVVAIRAARVGTFNGKSLSTSASSQFVVSPDIPEANKLATWYSENNSSPVVAISDGGNGMGGEGGQGRDETVKTLASVQSEQLGMGTQADYFTCVACINTIKHDGRISYTACPQCNSKVAQGTDGQYFCAKCNRSLAEAVENYTLRMMITDSTGSLWVTCFRDAAMRIMNDREASELVALQTGGNETEFNMAFDDAAHKWYQFRIRAKQDSYREEVRVQYSVISVNPIDYDKECHRLLSIIDSYP